MNTQKSVYNKLSKIQNESNKIEHQELSVEKVELALVDDAKKLIGKYADIDEDRAASLVVQAERAYDKVSQEYSTLIMQIEKAIPDLEDAIQKIGINRSNFQVLDDLDEAKRKAKERLKNAQKAFNQLKSIDI